MTTNVTPTPVYLDPGMHPGLEVKGLRRQYLPNYYVKMTSVFTFVTYMISFNRKNMTNVTIFLWHAFKEIV